MSIRRFFFASLALAVIGVGLHLTALKQYSCGAYAIAQAATLSDSELLAARLDASRLSSRGAVVSSIGLAFAFASVGFVIVSARKHEPAWRSLTLGLLGFYVILQFISV
jgi:hypothetical protein